MKKSISTRFKITKNGKVLSRTKGQCHFKANKSTKQLLRKAGHSNVSKAMKNAVTKSPNKF